MTIFNDKDQKSPQNRLIAFMERKSELLSAKNILFTAEDVEDLLSWPDDQAEEVIAKILKENFSRDIDICPWCVLDELNCSSCTFSQRHGKCQEGKFDTYSKILETISEGSFVNRLAPHKIELLALLRGEKEKTKNAR